MRYHPFVSLVLFWVLTSLIACSHDVRHHNIDSAIYTTETLDFLSQEIEVLDQNSLVIFDLNKVLLTKKDPWERGYEKERKNAISAPSLHVKGSTLSQTFDQPTRDYLWSIYARSISLMLVDKYAPKKIQALQKKSIKVMGLTSFPVGKCGTIPSLVDWRVQNIISQGIDFSLSAPYSTTLTFLQFSHDGQSPIYQNGILFTGLFCSKGTALKAFLEKIKWKPTQIIMIDDKIDNLTSVQKELQSLHIPFRGYEYTAYEKLPAYFDKEIVEAQMQYLMQHHKWIEANKIKGMAVQSVQRKP